MEAALVHDWLIQMGGAERVLAALTLTFQGPIYTLITDNKTLKTSPFFGRDIRTSYLQHMPWSSSIYPYLLPLLPSAIQQLDLSGHDLIISSSFALAKSIITSPNQLHICYCHSPFRAAWDFSDVYLARLPKPLRPIASALLHYVRAFDQKTHHRVDHFIANSHNVAARIRRCYGREAEVIYPPVDVESFQPAAQRQDFYLTCSRLAHNKRIDLLLQAFAQMPDRQLLVIGDGPEGKKLRLHAPPNVRFLGRIHDRQLRQLLPQGRAFCSMAEEDFGIAMVEAQAAGIPVIAYGKGGSQEAVWEGATGVLFSEQTVEAFCDAIQKCEKVEKHWQQETIRRFAETFSTKRFLCEIEDFVRRCGGR